jgi:abortive infection bacteriophage resistance protein
MTQYSKPFLTYTEQLHLLKSRGLVIDDQEQALRDLRRFGYYRLGAYWYPFRIRLANHREGIDTPSDQVHPGVSFAEIVRIAEFDGSLRSTIWPALETAEVAIRVAIAYRMGQYGAYTYVDPAHLALGATSPSIRKPEMTKLDELKHYMQAAVRSSKESFAKHFLEKYEGTLPVWAAIELWDFGTLATYYQIMRAEDREEVASTFDLRSARLLGSWVEALNVLRNICAHHGRLNRRHMAVSPRIPKPLTAAEFAHLYPLRDTERHTLYPLLCVLRGCANRCEEYVQMSETQAV